MPTMQHIGLVRFKADVSEQAIVKIFADLKELQDLIPGILAFKWGPYSSPEGLNRDFTHGFLMEFETAATRDDYLNHPEHERVKAAILPHVADVVIFDFES